VSEACAGALPRVWADGRLLDAGAPVFGRGEALGGVGSLAIIPLRSSREVTGAIVMVGRAAHDVGLADVRNLELLAAMSAVSLETLWQLDEFTRRARTDQLTGLPNRRAFDEALTPALVLADRYELPLSLIMIDIDHFKTVNDSYGHAVGDAVLQSVARTVQGVIRESDLCARYGGEEIAVLLPNTPQKGAEELAERLRAAVERQPVRAEKQDVRVTASFGVAAVRESTTARLGLFEAADAALYEAKAAGRNQVKSAKAPT
jgi:diguanylate cyclase (GGDEF)-like protein